jgi:large subunit ribosomal protein L18
LENKELTHMVKKPDKNKTRLKRHIRVRKKISGTPERPRLNVYRSLNHIYAQLIDDTAGQTLVSASTLDAPLKGSLKGGGNKEAAKAVGALIAGRAIERGLKRVVFDRGGYLYHGRVKELADAAREAGLEF